MSRLPTIPSCESVHLLAVEKNQKDFLSPVGTDDESEDGETETEPGRPYRSGSGSWHRQLSPCSVRSAASSGRLYAEPAQTLIFLDWDDTIFPCTEIFQKRHYSRKTREWTQLPVELEEDLSEWRDAAAEFLRAACGVSDRCVIVTNSKPPWVMACVEHFAPNLKPILQDRPQNLSIVYGSEFMKPKKNASDLCSEKAENLIIKFLQSSLGGCFSDFTAKVVESMQAMRRHAPRPPFDLTEAKLKAMTSEAENFYSQYQGQTWKNIISLGDMAYEYEAVKTLTATRGVFAQLAAPRERLRTKSVVLLPSPSLHGLTLQLRIWSQVLPSIARFDGDVDIDVSQNFAPFQELARALQLPTLAKLQVPQVYLQPISQQFFDEDFMNEEGSQSAANELLDQLPILLHDSFICPPKEGFQHVA